MGRHLVLVAAGGLVSLAGCILPVSTGAPLPATTVGQGKLGVAMSGEAPVLDLLADGDSYSELRGAAPAAAMTATLSYGLSEDTDLEVAGEGALYFFILPLPTGGSIGIRHRLATTELFDIALAGKLGGVTSSAGGSVSDGNRTESAASATYGAIQGVIQRREGWLRPLASVNVMPFRIRRAPSDEPSYNFTGLASSATFGLMMVGGAVQVGPYVTITNFVSDRFSGGWFPSYGLMFALRPDRARRRHQPVVPTTPYYGPPPPPYSAPPPAPYPAPAPYPMPPPAPYPAPAPAAPPYPESPPSPESPPTGAPGTTEPAR